jgi:ribonuclease BN (tRNA processing enzyme)
MKLTIVGCGDAFGSGGRMNTCFWLETAKATLVVDFGASSLVALKKAGLDPNAIDGIVLSHLHGDHSAGCRCCCWTINSWRGASGRS